MAGTEKLYLVIYTTLRPLIDGVFYFLKVAVWIDSSNLHIASLRGCD